MAKFIIYLFIFALAYTPLSATAKACKGRTSSACKGSCTWVSGTTRKDGVKVSSYCRSKGKNAKKKKKKKKKKKSKKK